MLPFPRQQRANPQSPTCGGHHMVLQPLPLDPVPSKRHSDHPTSQPPTAQAIPKAPFQKGFFSLLNKILNIVKIFKGLCPQNKPRKIKKAKVAIILLYKKQSSSCFNIHPQKARFLLSASRQPRAAELSLTGHDGCGGDE